MKFTQKYVAKLAIFVFVVSLTFIPLQSVADNMRAPISEYEAVEAASMKFVKSVADCSSKYAREFFTEDVVLFVFFDGKWKCVAKAYNQNLNTIKKKSVFEEDSLQEHRLVSFYYWGCDSLWFETFRYFL